MGDTIVVVDYGMGNINSVAKTIRSLNRTPTITSDPRGIINAGRIILPGVGHFQKAMEHLKALNLLEALNEATLTKKRPILGICLGMQLMGKASEEAKSPGLGWIDGDVVKFMVHDSSKVRIPHMGWNRIRHSKQSALMKGIAATAEFYFVHSYHMKLEDSSDELNSTEYSYPFTSAIEKENIFGVQYHPEKSHDVGVQLLRNFIEI